MPTLSVPVTTPRQWTETELVRRVLADDARAWNELVRRYRPIMFRCIMKVLARFESHRGRADVEEVYGEALMSLVRDDMRKLRLWDPGRGARLGSWLGLLAKNSAYDYARGSANRTHTDRVDERFDLGWSGASPLDDMLASERRAQLADLLADYPARDREFLALCFGRNLSVEAVAAAMGISVKTVYTKKHKLLTRLAAMARAA
jgi:RNA polymerase sigma-70 factor (ECF subfamily)